VKKSLQPIWPSTIHGKWLERSGKRGLVSVVVPTYNRVYQLPDALDSVHSQEYRPIELIVVDDGSTDGTTELVEKWGGEHNRAGDFKVRYERQPNRGAPSARNLGALRSRGEFLQFLDSDDKLHPEKVASQVELLRENPKAGFVYCLSTFFEAEKPGERTAGFDFEKGGIPAMLRKNMYQTSAALYRRETCEAAGPWDEELGGAQEWEYGHRALLACGESVLFQPKVYNYIRSSKDSTRISQQGGEYVKERLKALNKVQDILAYERLLKDPKIAQALALSYLWISFELNHHRMSRISVRRALLESRKVSSLPLSKVSDFLISLHFRTEKGFSFLGRAIHLFQRVLHCFANSRSSK